MNIDKHKEIQTPQRAPQKREAPVPLRGPAIRRRSPGVPAPSKVDSLFKNRQQLNFDQNTGFHGGPSARRKGSRLAAWSLIASTVDALILISMSCVFILAFSLIVKSTLGSLLGGLAHSHHQSIFFAEVFCISAWFYTICTRTLMGATIGEWACDLRLGQPQERMQDNYLAKVALRSTLIVLTGFVTLPLISLIIGKDLPGVISGLRLFSLK